MIHPNDKYGNGKRRENAERRTRFIPVSCAAGCGSVKDALQIRRGTSAIPVGWVEMLVRKRGVAGTEEAGRHVVCSPLCAANVLTVEGAFKTE